MRNVIFSQIDLKAFDGLTDEQLLDLFKGFFAYLNKKDYVTEDSTVGVMLKMFTIQFNKYESENKKRTGQIQNKSEPQPIQSNEGGKDNSIEKEKRPKHRLHHKALQIYWGWFISRTNMNPKMDKAQGSALKDILIYFDGCKKSNGEKYTDQEILDNWTLILDRFDTLSEFLKAQVTLTQINKYLPNILDYYNKSRKKQMTVDTASKILSKFD